MLLNKIIDHKKWLNKIIDHKKWLPSISGFSCWLFFFVSGIFVFCYTFHWLAALVCVVMLLAMALKYGLDKLGVAFLCSLLVAGSYGISLPPLVFVVYILAVLVPLSGISFYYHHRDLVKKDLSLLNVMVGLLSLGHALMACIFPFYVEGWALLYPGLIVGVWGSLYWWTVVCLRPLPCQKMVHIGDYATIIVAQLGLAFSDKEGWPFFINLAIAGFLPFMFKGLQLFYASYRSWRPWVTALVGTVGILSVVPLVLLSLFIFFQPWIDYLFPPKERKKNNGPC